MYKNLNFILVSCILIFGTGISILPNFIEITDEISPDKYDHDNDNGSELQLTSSIKSGLTGSYSDTNIQSQEDSHLLRYTKYHKISAQPNLPNHEPIAFTQNIDFANHANWTGSGSQNDPYVFENYFIDGNGGSGISIAFTNVYFIIRNVIINNSNSALYFAAVNNGNVINNSISYSTTGIHLVSSNNNIIQNNSVSFSETGYFFSASTNNIIDNNTAINSSSYGFSLSGFIFNTFQNNFALYSDLDGFYIINSNSNLILNNTAINVQGTNAIGFYLSGSGSYNNTLRNNTATDSYVGFRLNSANNNSLIENLAYNNRISNFLLVTSHWNILNNNTANTTNQENYHLVRSGNNLLINNLATRGNEGFRINDADNNSLINNFAWDNNIGFGTWIQSDNNSYVNNTANKNSYGFYVISTNNATYINNSAVNNQWEGFYLHVSNNNTISNNIVSHNGGNGFRLKYSVNTPDPSNYNQISNNFIFNNTGYAFLIEGMSSRNSIHFNYISSNNGGFNQAYDEGLDNIFMFNQWTDWTSPDNDGNQIVDIPYSISGSLNNQDLYPLIEFFQHPIITLINLNNNSFLQSGAEIQVSIADPLELNQVIYNWDDGTNSTIFLNNLSYFFNIYFPVNEAQHFLHVYVQTKDLNWYHQYFILTTDNTPPEITLNSPVNGSTFQSGTAISILINNGNGSMIYHWDTDSNDTASDSFNPVLPIGEGLHQLYLYARDDAGNWNFTYFEFITDDPPQIFLSNPLNGTTHQSGTLIEIVTIDTNGSLIYNWDGTNNITTIDTFDPMLPVGDGLHQLYVYAQDEAGNWNMSYFEFYTDDTIIDPTATTLTETSSTQSLITTTPGFELVVMSLASIILYWKRRKSNSDRTDLN